MSSAETTADQASSAETTAHQASSAETTADQAGAAQAEKWEDCGYGQEVLNEARDWVLKQPDTSAVAFVLFRHGTVVFVTEAMVEGLEKEDSAFIPPLPKVPRERIRRGYAEHVAKRRQYVADESKRMSARDLLLYRAAVRYLAAVGYPTPGVSADHLIRLRDDGMWTAQYKEHRQAIMYMPKSLVIADGQTACAVVKNLGLRLDQMTLVPAFIHTAGGYDTVNRSINPETWDYPFQAGLYDDPKTVGLRVFTACPDPMAVLRAMFGGLKV